MQSSAPGSRHPERTTAQRAGEKDPVRHVSRSDSVYKYTQHTNEPTSCLQDVKNGAIYRRVTSRRMSD